MMILLFAREWAIGQGIDPITRYVLTFCQPITVHCVDGTRIADTITTIETFAGSDCLGDAINAVDRGSRENRRLSTVEAIAQNHSWWVWESTGDVWSSTDEITIARGDA